MCETHLVCGRERLNINNTIQAATYEFRLTIISMTGMIVSCMLQLPTCLGR